MSLVYCLMGLEGGCKSTPNRRRESSILNRMQEADLESGSSQNAERELSGIEKKLGPPKQTQGDPPVLGRTKHHTHSRERRKGR
ncbi:hypothetical protein F2Q70_00016737 [Brassica cretica]|uniref:Uncharacterized protein n=1 Tax=Brassica cretica TaxID=69181 RepID=A0A8S9KST7_BRACR|nr:hypothetical protein F2Q70_00016737 [Brassica cretica]KAF2598490.1 hypothetical protein F2Q68_00009718 [Brassica cretica]